jgi:two-component system, NtrC family, sensor histidine kinase HydH
MRVRLGIPDAVAGAPLTRRLAFVSVVRLTLQTVLLGLVGLFFLWPTFELESFTARVAVAALGAAFASTLAYALVLRSGRHLEGLVYSQLIFDQLTWTVAVYLSGGAASGATSFYGLTCLVGAMLKGIRGSGVAALAAALSYGALVIALHWGILPAPPDQPATLYQLTNAELAYYALVNILVLVVVALLGGLLAERLRLTRGHLQVAEQRAEQAERMAALGRLATGLAHEIRNPIGSIAGSIQLLKSSLALTEEERQLCEIVTREAARLNDLVTDMMDLARPRKPDLQVVDLAQVAREVVELSSYSGRAASDVEVVYRGAERAMVRADAAQVRQLVWNLVRNAVQASSAGDAVEVAIEVRDGCGELSVRDSGVGIEPEARARLFDAFFTTRSQGTGIGLAVVKRIADEHGFAIDVESESGQGATFRIDLGRLRSD